MIKILKASAGSGKTFALAHNYLKLLSGRYAYRHILAVTFTNKATAEMKGRILDFLAKSGEDAHKEALRDILHDYSAFSVSTIDKFFQQALKAFAREIGQVADYQIDLDKPALINEAMDRILDSLTADQTDILEWLRQNVGESLEQGRRVSIEDTLYQMGQRLMSEERRDLAEKYGEDSKTAYSKDRLSAVRANCEQIISDFTRDLNSAAKEVEVHKANSIKQLAPYLKGFESWQRIPLPRTTLLGEAEGSRFCELLTGERYRWYNTAWLLRDTCFSLGLAGEFYKSFADLLKEKNVMVLDESNTILKDIIAGSDAPFVYEKMGVRYENFLLDEFQDTSHIQWENFRPLLRESNAGGHQNLIVGDIKQSIYRWRDSDWSLLAEQVGRDFPDAETSSLKSNWRSCSTIVAFNNAFFKRTAEVIGRSGLYSDVEQEKRAKDKQPGSVRVSFREKGEQIPLVIESIQDAREAGAQYGDIAILVRGHKEGNSVASALIEAGIPVISDDSLYLKSSVILRKLTGILANHENPDDKINAFMAEAESVEFPEEFHSLVDLCENLLRQLQEVSPDIFAGETLYIQAFMDDLREWVDANGNELRYYLKHWEEKDLCISSPASDSAVKIITVHKSKGLQFPYLIFPFAEKVAFYKSDWHWCHLDTTGTPFIPEAAGLYPVNLDSGSAATLFSKAYEEEAEMQKVDNINVFYVALTRAEKCLHVIAEMPSKAFRDASSPDYKNFSQILYDFCGRMEDSFRGEKYDFLRMERDKKDIGQELPFRYISYPVGKRLKVSADAADFFGEDGAVGAAASPRRNGIALHGILSSVQIASDLEGAVEDAVLEGTLSPEEGRDALALLSKRIASHPEWFSSRGLNEVTVFDADGTEKRPDRVVIRDGEATIIDYKFGESTPESDARYSGQVSRYMKIFRSLGYTKVSGAVWYVVPDKMISL